MFLFLAVYMLSQGVQVAGSFWLSDWSNKADEESDKPELRNKRLIVYVVYGISQSKLIES